MIPSSSVSSSGVMKICPLPIFFEKPALEQSLVNFCCSESSANFCSHSHNKFPTTSASVGEIVLAVRNSVGITIGPKFSFAAGFPALYESPAIFYTSLLLLRRY